ncbi:MAG: DNA polymerase V [SAR86 cluster bacterium]|uniref:DNA polymerase V n=1 Tax=SAR86 cluster bacterium TaxID=2030880 RepID=A0A2A5B9B4_9GAMM|nr:MAG: DNA polymerase V [SAR86 cluster bacterium]
MKVTLIKIKDPKTALSLPLYSSRVPAGFPSPADDYIEDILDLNEYLVKHPTASFYARGEGNSMVNCGILDQALLIVDRSIEPAQDDIVIAVIDGEMTCKILDKKGHMLRAANPSYSPIPITEGMELTILGIVVHAVNQLCMRS